MQGGVASAGPDAKPQGTQRLARICLPPPGHPTAARPLKSTLDEERRADKALSKLGEQRLNFAVAALSQLAGPDV